MITPGFLATPIGKYQKILGQVCCGDVVGKGELPREEKAPITPDVLDALDAFVVSARPWGRWIVVGCVECVGLNIGFWGTEVVVD